MRIDQLVPSFAPYDAIGNHVLKVRSVLRAAGFSSDIYGELIDPQLASEAMPFADCVARAGEDRVLLYQSSTNSAMVPWLLERAAHGQRVVSNYHNVTPAEYFDRWEPQAAEAMRQGRADVARLAPWVSLGLADSEFNRRELVELGYARTMTTPLLVDLDIYHRDEDAAARARRERQRDQGVTRWLFVGRVAPNKCQHDVIAAFALYRRLFAPQARLTLVGGVTSPRYYARLLRMVRQLEVDGHVEFATRVPFERLLDHYARADVFVCQSEHEGFCIPVLEAMELGVPIVAHAAAALPDTVADAGVVLHDKDPMVVAVAVDGLLGDTARRDALVRAGRRRAQEFSFPVTSKVFVSAITEWLADQAG